MTKLKVGGDVVWLDGTPVKNGRIRLYDEDLGGNGNDLIFERETNALGRYKGTTAVWEDANEATLPGGFKVPASDLLALKFQVRVSDGRTHQGSYIRLGDYASVPIVLPWLRPNSENRDPVRPVQQSQRELIHVITLSDQVPEKDKALYQVIEFAAGLTSQTAGRAYNQIRILKEGQATLLQLKEALEDAASQPGIRAVDLVVSTHGLDEALYFYPNQSQTMEQVADVLGTIPQHYRAKFRALFSTACFGASHRDEWLQVGFKMASGSRQIFADGAVSYAAFLSTWSLGATFQQAIIAANAADPGRVSDQLARWKYQMDGHSNLAAQIDSHRLTMGNTALTINSVP